MQFPLIYGGDTIDDQIITSINYIILLALQLLQIHLGFMRDNISF